VESNRNCLTYSGNQARAGSDTSIGQTAAEFDSMSPTPFGDHGRFNRIDAHFQDNVFIHDGTHVRGVGMAQIGRLIQTFGATFFQNDRSQRSSMAQRSRCAANVSSL
jgi:hypothetical protein